MSWFKIFAALKKIQKLDPFFGATTFGITTLGKMRTPQDSLTFMLSVIILNVVATQHSETA